MPDDLQKAVAGVKSGDYRLYGSPEKGFYVLYIQEVVPPKSAPYEEVRDEIAKTIFDDKLKKGVEDYADKLKAVSDVKIYWQENR